MVNYMLLLVALRSHIMKIFRMRWAYSSSCRMISIGEMQQMQAKNRRMLVSEAM